MPISRHLLSYIFSNMMQKQKAEDEVKSMFLQPKPPIQTYIHNFNFRCVIYAVLRQPKREPIFAPCFVVSFLWLQAKIYTEKWGLINGYIV